MFRPRLDDHHVRPWPARKAWAGVRSPARPTCDRNAVGAIHPGAPNCRSSERKSLKSVALPGLAVLVGLVWPVGFAGLVAAGGLAARAGFAVSTWLARLVGETFVVVSIGQATPRGVIGLAARPRAVVPTTVARPADLVSLLAAIGSVATFWRGALAARIALAVLVARLAL